MQTENFPRTDEESLELTRISKIQRMDAEFSMDELVEKNRHELDRYKPMNDWILIVEDMAPRNDGAIVPIRNRHYQFKGMVYAKGPDVQSNAIQKGTYVLWGLYNGKYVEIAPGIHTWLVREMRILAVVESDVRLTE